MTQPTRPAANGGQGPAPKPALAGPARLVHPSIVIEYQDAEGWPVQLTLPGPATGEEIAAAIGMASQAVKILKSRNAKPRAIALAAPVPGAEESGPGAPPVCKYHGGLMKLGRGGKWFCPKKIAGGAYCDYTIE